MRQLTFLLALGVYGALSYQGTKASAQVEEPLLEGRNIQACNVAVERLREMSGSDDGLPEKWGRLENYVVSFEGLKDGCYVMHFMPHFDPKAKSVVGYDRRYGIPFRFFVREKDLTIDKVVME